MKRKSSGLFVTFEGGEGVGKTTLIDSIYEALTGKGYCPLKTFEPGGTPLGVSIRELLLHQDRASISKRSELYLFLADRSQHVQEVLLPALREGKIVLCDRFNDSTMAYQGAARHLDRSLLRNLCFAATEGLTPDLTLYLDLDPQVGLQRARKDESFDRLERENLKFHEQVRQGFLTLAREEPQRFRTINAENERKSVYRKAMAEIESML